MKGIENIRDLITSEAQKKAEVLIAAANDNAKKAAEQAEIKARELADNLQRKAEADAAALLESEKTAERLAGGKAELNVKQALLKESFALAEQRTCALPQAEYMDMLVSLIKNATADGAGGEIVLSKTDLDAFGQSLCERVNKNAVGEALSLCPVGELTGKGAVVRRARIELNCQIGAIISHIQDQSAQEVSDILFRG